MTPICFRRVLSSELPQRSTILPSLNLEICNPRILTFLPVGVIFPRGPVCVPVSSSTQGRRVWLQSSRDGSSPKRCSRCQSSPVNHSARRQETTFSGRRTQLHPSSVSLGNSGASPKKASVFLSLER